MKKNHLLHQLKDQHKEKKKKAPDIKSLLKNHPGLKKISPPKKIKPMLATLVDEPFDNDDWLFEIKWDGYRAIGSVIKGKAELYSRNNVFFNDRFAEIVAALEEF